MNFDVKTVRNLELTRTGLIVVSVGRFTTIFGDGDSLCIPRVENGTLAIKAATTEVFVGFAADTFINKKDKIIEVAIMTDYSKDQKYVRTSEEVNASLESAKIKLFDLKPCSQILYSTTIDEGSNIKLVELDNELLATLKEQKCLFFKGQPQNVAVLTSSNQTYELREAETSNTLLLFPTMKLSQDIDVNESQDTWEAKQTTGGMLFHTYYETSRCQPKLEKLLTLLEPSSFKGSAYEKHIDKGILFDWERLRREIQASDQELIEAFDKYSIALIDGFYRLVSFEYKAQALTMMLDVMEENSWELDQVNKEETYTALKELIPKSAFDIIFDKYAQSNNNDQLLTYNEEKVCRFLAQILLAASPINEYKQFMDAWRMGVPLKMKPKPEYLHGVAITRWNSQEARKEIVSFPASNLAEDINNRLNELFKAKDKWTIEEITPYILNCGGNSDVNFLLTKYARSSVVNGVKYYSSKYNK